jgi:3-phosphoshikimate 1-carboxyvinyltransferase
MIMSLPDLIEIVPLEKMVRAEISVPGSKSITNRALILAALSQGETVLEGALWSEDTQVMVDCLQEIGFMIQVQVDGKETCNRTITVYGMGGKVPPGGTLDQPLDLFVGNAGTAARFLAAFVCLGSGVYRLDGVSRMHERPQAALFQALRSIGYRIDAPNDHLPALIHGKGPRSGRCQVSIEQSSQFASALLLCALTGKWNVEITGEDAEESPYVEMTSKLISVFPRAGGRFEIEPDASSGSYFWGANWLLQNNSSIQVAHWPKSGWQKDASFPRFLPFPPEISRRKDLGDSIMTAITLAPLHSAPVRFTDLGRLRLQECERVAALRTELTRCGANVREIGDILEITPSEMHGAEIETYHDHRMAMCFAILGLKVPGIKIKNPACVKKTFPNFFQKLAAPPPFGLGALMGRPENTAPKAPFLGLEELFAI